MRWVKVPANEVHSVCARTSGEMIFLNGKVNGCATWSTSPCVIYAPDPAGESDIGGLAILGHELKHCFDRNWHASRH